MHLHEAGGVRLWACGLVGPDVDQGERWVRGAREGAVAEHRKRDGEGLVVDEAREDREDGHKENDVPPYSAYMRGQRPGNDSIVRLQHLLPFL